MIYPSLLIFYLSFSHFFSQVAPLSISCRIITSAVWLVLLWKTLRHSVQLETNFLINSLSNRITVRTFFIPFPASKGKSHSEDFVLWRLIWWLYDYSLMNTKHQRVCLTVCQWVDSKVVKTPLKFCVLFVSTLCPDKIPTIPWETVITLCCYFLWFKAQTLCRR